MLIILYLLLIVLFFSWVDYPTTYNAYHNPETNTICEFSYPFTNELSFTEEKLEFSC